MFETRLRVIYGDTDQMGVVYYANYLRYFEYARGEYMRAKGSTYRELEQAGGRLPVVEAHCRYKVPARYDDLLGIGLEVTELRRVTLTFEYEVRRVQDDRLLCTGKTVHACIGEDGKPMRLPDKFARLVNGKLTQQSN
jgi:acyl-CoA thioester hydrolase